MVIFTNRFIPEQFAGYTVFCFALIRPEYREDLGLIEHEKTHVKQFWRLPFIHGLRYRFSKSYRLNCEVEAYKEQLKHYKVDRTYLLAKHLVDHYNFDLSIKDAMTLLKVP